MPPLNDSPFLSPLTQERVIYLFRKLWVVAVYKSYEIGKQVCHGRLQMSFSKSVGTFISSLKFEDLPFWSQLIQKRFIYFFRKPWIVGHETSFENGSRLVMELGRLQINFDKIVPFSIRWVWPLQGWCKPSFFPYSLTYISGYLLIYNLF